VPCWSDRFAAVLWWNPMAVSWLTDGSFKQRCCCFKRRRERFLLFPSPLVFCFFLSLLSLSSGFSLCTPYLFFSQIPSFVSSFPIFFPSSLYFVSSLSILSILFSFFVPLLCWRWVVFIGQREWGCPYCRPIAAHREQGFIALPRRWVSWPMGMAGRARLPGFPS